MISFRVPIEVFRSYSFSESGNSSYGEQRNDELKTHPCLVPYEELPDSEKEYDRNTSIGTLKLIMKLGFKISC